MIKSLTIFLITFLLTACKIKQWNLNQSVGWKSETPNDYTVLFIKWNQTVFDSTQISLKKKLDEAVLKELKSKLLGEQAENDDPAERDLLFVVSRDYKKALAVILSVTETFDLKQKVTAYQRDYKSFDKWVDRILYPE